MNATPLFGRAEIALSSARDYENAVQDVRVTVEFRCGGESRRVEAFWDGGRTWLARLLVDREGEWSWRSSCSHAVDASTSKPRPWMNVHSGS